MSLSIECAVCRAGYQSRCVDAELVGAVGTQESMLQAIRSTRHGGHVGYVVVSHGVELPGQELFFAEVHRLAVPPRCAASCPSWSI
jgi:hypothetical protein